MHVKLGVTPSVQLYFDQLEANSLPPPLNVNGSLNLSKIAKDCQACRSIIYQNKMLSSNKE
jgi:hypothetical protein